MFACLFSYIIGNLFGMEQQSQEGQTMVGMEACTYEKIYFALWEAARRYQDFTQFRVIGNSHDDRMIPMLEVGTGQAVVFCLSGLHGTDRQMPGLLVNMALEYCNAYECGWTLEHFYEVKTLLDEVRLCFIPVLNPDGYEIQAQGYSVIRNPIHRQMLRMKNLPTQEFFYNARGIDLRKNFPTSFVTRKSLLQEPASENETKALIRIFQEYNSLGLLSFCKSEKKLIYFRQPQSFSYNQKSYRLAKHLQKCADYHLERHPHQNESSCGTSSFGAGSPEQFYGETCRQPAFVLEQMLADPDTISSTDSKRKTSYQEAHILPLEYLYSLEE